MSTLHDSAAAGADAARRACAALAGAPSCCLVFGGAGYDQAQLLSGVRSVVGRVAIAGCSGEGVIAGGCSDERDRVVSVLAIASETIDFTVISRDDYATDPIGCGRGLAAGVAGLGRSDVFALMVFTDGLSGHCGQFLSALQGDLPAAITVIGGAAGDGMEFTRTFQYASDRVTSGGVVAVALAGRGSARVAVSHGCTPIGLERTVTAARDGWLYEIDGRPAWSVFKEYLDGDPVDLNAEGIVHLCFGEPLAADAASEYDPFIIHTPLQLDRATGALFFPGGGFTTGAKVRMTRRDPTLIRNSAEHCARALVGDGRRKPALVLQVDCAGRGRILFGGCAADEIIAPLQRVIGHVPWIGFHSYGEIAPVAGKLHYHNYTVALCAIYDDV